MEGLKKSTWDGETEPSSRMKSDGSGMVVPRFRGFRRWRLHNIWRVIILNIILKGFLDRCDSFLMKACCCVSFLVRSQSTQEACNEVVHCEDPQIWQKLNQGSDPKRLGPV